MVHLDSIVAFEMLLLIDFPAVVVVNFVGIDFVVDFVIIELGFEQVAAPSEIVVASESVAIPRLEESCPIDDEPTNS